MKRYNTRVINDFTYVYGPKLALSHFFLLIVAILGGVYKVTTIPFFGFAALAFALLFIVIEVQLARAFIVWRRG